MLAFAPRTSSLIAALIISGCSANQGPPLIPVSGTVVFDGKPYPGAGIAFHPDATKGNKFPQFVPGGIADEQGKYELQTTGRAGAPPGWYRVVVAAPVTVNLSSGEKPRTVAPPFARTFSDPTQSTLSIEVTAGASPKAYEINLVK